MNDIVYILKEGIDPYELRYSLRSLKNMEHGKVWFYGGQPAGLTPDGRGTTEQRGETKWQRVRSSLEDVCRNDEITPQFWLFNDDFFVLKPVEGPLFNGTLRDHILHVERRHYGETAYTKQLRACETLLKDAGLSTFNYAIHVPMLVDREKMLEALRTFPDCPMFRSLYGNFAEIGGNDHRDVKIVGLTRGYEDDADYVSTSDDSFEFGAVGAQLRHTFKEPCRYEDGSGKV